LPSIIRWPKVMPCISASASVAYSSGIQYGMDSVAPSCSKKIEIRSCHWPVSGFCVGTELMV